MTGADVGDFLKRVHSLRAELLPDGRRDYDLRVVGYLHYQRVRRFPARRVSAPAIRW